MTQPVEDVEKLAERVWIALLTKARESDALMHEFDDGMAQGLIAAEMRTNFAARDAELQRLRGAAEQCASKAMTHFGYYSSGREIAETLRTALHHNHQEPSDGSS